MEWPVLVRIVLIGVLGVVGKLIGFDSHRANTGEERLRHEWYRYKN
jgi:hypothetical protein